MSGRGAPGAGGRRRFPRASTCHPLRCSSPRWAGGGATVTSPWLVRRGCPYSHVRQRQRPSQQRVVVEVDLADRQVVRRPPVGVHPVQQLRVEGARCHACCLLHRCADGDSSGLVPSAIASHRPPRMMSVTCRSASSAARSARWPGSSAPVRPRPSSVAGTVEAARTTPCERQTGHPHGVAYGRRDGQRAAGDRAGRHEPCPAVLDADGEVPEPVVAVGGACCGHRVGDEHGGGAFAMHARPTVIPAPPDVVAHGTAQRRPCGPGVPAGDGPSIIASPAECHRAKARRACTPRPRVVSEHCYWWYQCWKFPSLHGRV